MTDSKSRSQQRFSAYAERYVTSPNHATGAELPRLVELAQPAPQHRVLDIATGGGHTARTFAPHVRLMVAGDLSESMLRAASGSISRHNTVYVTTDAENLAFAPDTFDLVTCRIAPHHFPDCFRFVMECARVLKPGGKLLVQDQTLPEDEDAARFIEAFETLRDPSHHRAYSPLEWRGMYLDASLEVDHIEEARNRSNLVDWAKRQDCPDDLITRLQIMLAQAPDAVKAQLRPGAVGTPAAEFDHVYVIIVGHKPA